MASDKDSTFDAANMARAMPHARALHSKVIDAVNDWGEALDARREFTPAQIDEILLNAMASAVAGVIASFPPNKQKAAIDGLHGYLTVILLKAAMTPGTVQ